VGMPPACENASAAWIGRAAVSSPRRVCATVLAGRACGNHLNIAGLSRRGGDTAPLPPLSLTARFLRVFASARLCVTIPPHARPLRQRSAGCDSEPPSRSDRCSRPPLVPNPRFRRPKMVGPPLAAEMAGAFYHCGNDPIAEFSDATNLPACKL
jgi:hypothetical protein